jgi:purine-binding chemotaxis protein CheW
MRAEKFIDEKNDLSAPAGFDEANLEFLSFAMHGEYYGVDINKVREIKCLNEITRLPNTKPYIIGVVNLRGVIITVYNLAIRFEMEGNNNSDNSVIIFLNLGARIVGIVVDAVSDILNIKKDEIKVAPKMEVGIKDEYLIGLVGDDKKVVALLDTDKLFAGEVFK